jgi:hypothetical protein
MVLKGEDLKMAPIKQADPPIDGYIHDSSEASQEGSVAILLDPLKLPRLLTRTKDNAERVVANPLFTLPN